MKDKKTAANEKAWEIWQDARRKAAAASDIQEWQRLARTTTALDKAHPIYGRPKE